MSAKAKSEFLQKRIFSEIHFYKHLQQTIYEWNKILWLELGLSTL